MITSREIVGAVLELILLALEVYFVVWTTKNINRLKQLIHGTDTQNSRIDLLYSERESDFYEHENLKKKIVELEKKIEKLENKNPPE